MISISTGRAKGDSGADATGRGANSPAQIPTRGWKQVAARTWKQSSEDNVGLVAAGVAFYSFLALVPLLGATVLTYGLGRGTGNGVGQCEVACRGDAC